VDALQQVVCLLQLLLALQLFMQQTALITPHVKTTTKTIFNIASNFSLQLISHLPNILFSSYIFKLSNLKYNLPN